MPLGAAQSVFALCACLHPQILAQSQSVIAAGGQLRKQLLGLLGSNHMGFVLSGDAHQHNGLQHLVCSQFIIDSNDLTNLQMTTPGCHDLTVNQSVVDTEKVFSHNHAPNNLSFRTLHTR